MNGTWNEVLVRMRPKPEMVRLLFGLEYAGWRDRVELTTSHFDLWFSNVGDPWPFQRARVHVAWDTPLHSSTGVFVVRLFDERARLLGGSFVREPDSVPCAISYLEQIA